MNSNQTLMLCCLPYALETVRNYLFMCVFPLEDDLHGSSFCFMVSKVWRNLELELPLQSTLSGLYMDWAILIIIFHLCHLFEKVDHGHFWDHSLFLCEICWGAYKQSVKQCKASDFPMRKMPCGIFRHKITSSYSAQRNK